MRYYGKGKQRKRSGEMNSLEKRYARHLDDMKALGQVKWWGYECTKFRLADKTWYTPDFMVLSADDCYEAHETKGFMLTAANVKIKVAADIHPITFRLVKWDTKEKCWDVDEI